MVIMTNCKSAPKNYINSYKVMLLPWELWYGENFGPEYQNAQKMVCPDQFSFEKTSVGLE